MQILWHKKKHIGLSEVTLRSKQVAVFLGETTSTFPHYHIKKCVEKLHISKKNTNFAA